MTIISYVVMFVVGFLAGGLFVVYRGRIMVDRGLMFYEGADGNWRGDAEALKRHIAKKLLKKEKG